MYNIIPRHRKNRNNRTINLEVWFAIFVNVAALWINYVNLQYNKAQAYQSARVADQLSRLNRSTLMIDINNQLNKEKEEKPS